MEIMISKILHTVMIGLAVAKLSVIKWQMFLLEHTTRI